MESAIISAQWSISCTVLRLIWMFCFNETLIYTKGFKRWTVWSDVGTLWSRILERRSQPRVHVYSDGVQSFSFLMIYPIHFHISASSCAVIAHSLPCFWQQCRQFDQTEKCQVFFRVFCLQKLLSLYLTEQRFCWVPGFQPISEYQFEN